MVLGMAASLGVCAAEPVWANDPNTLTDEEKQAGFELLFNGHDLRGWEPARTSLKLKDGP